MANARALIAASPDFWDAVYPAAEIDGQYLLLVEWQDIASHRDGFRRSDRYAEWREFYMVSIIRCLKIYYFAEPLCLT